MNFRRSLEIYNQYLLPLFIPEYIGRDQIVMSDTQSFHSILASLDRQLHISYSVDLVGSLSAP